MLSRTLVTMMTALCFAGCGGGGSDSPPPPAPVPPPPAPAPAPPAPTITTLTPAGTTAEGSNFVLTVTGTGFVATSVIHWNGSARATTFVNATNLQAPIAASDIANAGTPPITVVNAAADGGTSAAMAFSITNPAPTISSVTPTLAAPGGPQFVLTVNGGGFVSPSVVKWNGVDRATTFVSASQLTATIPATDIATQGSAQVTVFNAAPGGGTSGESAVQIGNPVPLITQLVPPVVRPGGAAFNLKLLGSAFISGAEGRWNGAALPTTFVSNTELQLAVAATDIATAGSAQVVAANPAPGGGASSPVAFTIAPYGVIDRLSVATDGSEANGNSDEPSLSADGRFVAFVSEATNLVAGDTNGVQDIFVRDTCFGASSCTPSTERISVATGGSAADSASSKPSISANGRYVAFESAATNLVAGDTNGGVDIFVRDTCASAAGCTPTTYRVSVSTDGSQGNLPSSAPSISGDGRFVSFVTESILVLGDINAAPDAFVRDTCAGASGCVPATTRISAANDAIANNRGSGSGTSMGANGRYVAFMSFQRCQGCNILNSQIYVFDSCTGAPAGCTPAASLAAQYANSTGDLALNDRSLSADGRFVAYAKVNSGFADVLLADSCIGAPAGCTIASRTLTSSASNLGYAVAPRLTDSGRFGSFGQNATFPIANILVHDTCVGASAGCALKVLKISESDAGVAADDSNFNSQLSADGSRAVFASNATNLVAGDANARRDIFLARTGFSP